MLHHLLRLHNQAMPTVPARVDVININVVTQIVYIQTFNDTLGFVGIVRGEAHGFLTPL